MIATNLSRELNFSDFPDINKYNKDFKLNKILDVIKAFNDGFAYELWNDQVNSYFYEGVSVYNKDGRLDYYLSVIFRLFDLTETRMIITASPGADGDYSSDIIEAISTQSETFFKLRTSSFEYSGNLYPDAFSFTFLRL